MGCEPGRPKGPSALGPGPRPLLQCQVQKVTKGLFTRAGPPQPLASCSHSRSQHLCERRGAATSVFLRPFRKGESWRPCPSVHPGACPICLSPHRLYSICLYPSVGDGYGRWGCGASTEGVSALKGLGTLPQTTWREDGAVPGPGESWEALSSSRRRPGSSQQAPGGPAGSRWGQGEGRAPRETLSAG